MELAQTEFSNKAKSNSFIGIALFTLRESIPHNQELPGTGSEEANADACDARLKNKH